MTKNNDFYKPILGLIILGITIWVIYNAVVFILIGISSVRTELATGILAASGIIIASLITTVIGKYIEKNYETELQHRANKTAMYEEFLKLLFEIYESTLLKSETQSQKFSKEALVPAMAKFTKNLIVWGSPGVIRSYSDFRKLSQIQSGELSHSTSILWSIEKLLFEIRKDIGNSNRNLKEGDLHSLFINNDALSELKESKKM
ncbi:MAG: hypothetical protein JW999_06815 [Methanotrichaceae archaeon]|nr:hypothetical protein [Methanotrichaceae archaeon]